MVILYHKEGKKATIYIYMKKKRVGRFSFYICSFVPFLKSKKEHKKEHVVLLEISIYILYLLLKIKNKKGTQQIAKYQRFLNIVPFFT